MCLIDLEKEYGLVNRETLLQMLKMYDVGELLNELRQCM